jgi:hypothetical protein
MSAITYTVIGISCGPSSFAASAKPALTLRELNPLRVQRGLSYTALRVDNDFQNPSLHSRRDPDFPLRTLNIFPTNDANQ